MSDDWRVTGTAGGEIAALELMHRLHRHEADLPQRVAASRDGSHVFAYADTRGGAVAAQRELAEIAPDIQWSLSRWHHEEERWEDPDVPLPATPEEHAREHARLEADETSDSQSTGLAEWEIRVEFPTHHEARAFAEREQADGQAIARRWKYVLIGLNDQDDAEALAKRLQAELPPDAVMHVEPGSGLAWELLPKNAFAVFGGLGV
jgi:hypothetical protein